MSVRAYLGIALGLYAWSVQACSLPGGRAGAVCQRSTQCAPGFGCIAARCSKDLRSVAAKNTVPRVESAGTASGSPYYDSGADARN
jgi:hypothetical protein